MGQQSLIALAAVASHDTAQRRIGFKRGCVNANRLPVYQPRFGELLKDPGENLPAFRGRSTDAYARSWSGRAAPPPIPYPEMGAAQRSQPPARQWRLNRALRSTNQQQSKIATGRQTGSPHRLRIKPLAQLLNVRIKPALVQNPIQSLIERMCARCWQIVRGNPYRRLSPTPLTFSHGHACDCTTSSISRE